MMLDRLAQQIQFILEIDRLKAVTRRSYLIGGARHENSAEHSWHLAMMALLLAEYADEPVDVCRVVKLVLIHDIVEIDAGDTYVYNTQDVQTQAIRERRAAERIFGLLPPDQAREMWALWDEFEARETPEARFAAALDLLMPQLHNYHTQGRSWQENGATSEKVKARAQRLRDGSTQLWQYSQALIDDAIARGYLAPPGDDTVTR